MKCLIWNNEAKINADGNFDGKSVNSPRAGGRYKATGTVLPRLERLTDEQRAVLTTWLVDQRRLGEVVPTIDSYNIEQVLSRARLPIAERCNRALTYIGNVSGRLDSEHDLFEEHADYLCAHAELLAPDEIDALQDFLVTQGWLLNLQGNVRLTMDGIQHLEDLRRSSAASSQGFVAMWFDTSMEAAYTEGIAPAVRDVGYNPLRIDSKEHANKIDDEIIAEIRRSRFVVADFTSEIDKPRGGVYFEAGFAKGLGIEVIWTCRADMIGHVHFDTRQFNHILWQTPMELREKLARRISAILGDGPLHSESR